MADAYDTADPSNNANEDAYKIREAMIQRAKNAMTSLLEGYSSLWKRNKTRMDLFYQVCVIDGTCKIQDRFFKLQPRRGKPGLFNATTWICLDPHNIYRPVLISNGVLAPGVYFSPACQIYTAGTVYGYSASNALPGWQATMRAYVNLPPYPPRQRYFYEPCQSGVRLVARSRNDIRVPEGWTEVFPIDYRIALNSDSYQTASNTWVAEFPHQCSSSYIDFTILYDIFLLNGPGSDLRKVHPGSYCGGYGGLSKLPVELQLQIIESQPRYIDIDCSLQEQFPYIAQEYIKTMFHRWKKWLQKLSSRESLRYVGTKSLKLTESIEHGTGERHGIVDLYRLRSYDKHPDFKISSKDYSPHPSDLESTVPDLVAAEFRLAVALERFFWHFHVSGRPSPAVPPRQSSMVPMNHGSESRLRAHATGFGAIWSGLIIEAATEDNAISEIPIMHLAITIDSLRLKPFDPEPVNLTEEQNWKKRHRSNAIAAVFIFYDELVAMCEDMEIFIRPRIAPVNYLLQSGSIPKVLRRLPQRFRRGELGEYAENANMLFSDSIAQMQFENDERILGYAAEMWEALEAH